MDWYTGLLGAEPYFSRPVEGRLAYAEFRIGDYQHELGILDRRFAAPGPSDKAGCAIVYWHVDDVQASFGRLLALGAAAHEAPIERGPGREPDVTSEASIAVAGSADDWRAWLARSLPTELRQARLPTPCGASSRPAVSADGTAT